MAIPGTFVWGLKRSGIHFFVNWLYANLGATQRDQLDAKGLHHQLRDGFCDREAGIAFFNNCGITYSRQFSLGTVRREDFEAALHTSTAAIFGIEDCWLRPGISRVPTGGHISHVLLARDPLNNLASRLRGQRKRPDVLPVDTTFVDLFDSYCREYLQWTNELPKKVTVNYNRFVTDRSNRDAIALALGVKNLDMTSEVSAYGGGSSFRSDGVPDSHASLMTRFREQPIPPAILEYLVTKPAILEICTSEFGYNLLELSEELMRVQDL